MSKKNKTKLTKKDKIKIQEYYNKKYEEYVKKPLSELKIIFNTKKLSRTERQALIGATQYLLYQDMHKASTESFDIDPKSKESEESSKEVKLAENEGVTSES